MLARCPGCGERTISVRAKICASVSRPFICSRCGQLGSVRGLSTMLVPVASELLALPLVFISLFFSSVVPVIIFTAVAAAADALIRVLASAKTVTDEERTGRAELRRLAFVGIAILSIVLVITEIVGFGAD